jgi:hypothetical protein
LRRLTHDETCNERLAGGETPIVTDGPSLRATFPV